MQSREQTMSSGQVLRQLEGIARDPRFRAMSMQDFQNILTAIDLCGLGFRRGSKVAEDLNLLLTDEWPPRQGEQSVQKLIPTNRFL
jgi:hypothetical protein